MSKNFRTVLFDLDGTLTDSSASILNCVRYALKKMNMEIPDETVLKKFLGPPLDYSYGKFCGMNAEQVRETVTLHRERYKEYCVTENSLYDGVYGVLERLYGEGVRLAVATSKPEKFSVPILEGFGIKKFFTAVCCAPANGADVSKAAVIGNALAACCEDDLSRAVMVGDRFYDIEGAKTVGIASIGALYGYGSRSELEQYGADYIVTSPGEIAKIIL